MSGPSKGEIFVSTYVVGFGLLGGFFAKIGTDPESALVNALLPFLQQYDPFMAFTLSLAFTIISAIVPIVYLREGYQLGGVVGIVAIAFAWLAGYFHQSMVAGYLAIIAIILGYFAPIIRNRT